ncbi:hypothetical protein PENTCL1PPCAC_11065, partial [Pristionchus entomophagus]
FHCQFIRDSNHTNGQRVDLCRGDGADTVDWNYLADLFLLLLSALLGGIFHLALLLLFALLLVSLALLLLSFSFFLLFFLLLAFLLLVLIFL